MPALFHIFSRHVLGGSRARKYRFYAIGAVQTQRFKLKEYGDRKYTAWRLLISQTNRCLRALKRQVASLAATVFRPSCLISHGTYRKRRVLHKVVDTICAIATSDTVILTLWDEKEAPSG